MESLLFRSIAVLSSLAAPVIAEVPDVVTDIAPVHGLVSQVMDGVGAPALLLRQGQSPHTYSMRPSDARSLENADLVFWIGEGLTPWLVKPLNALATGATSIELLEIEDLPLLSYAEDDDHDDHDDHDDAKDDDHDDHGDVKDGDHDDHDDHDDAKEEDHDAHDDDAEHASEEEADHDKSGDHHHHGDVDPHAWLDPQIAQVWLGSIADALSTADPENAAAYQKNAKVAQMGLSKLDADLMADLVTIQKEPFVAFHDAYGYLEARYGLTNAGTVSPGDATRPGAAQILRLKKEIAERDIRCGFAEPQYDPALLKVAGEGSQLEISVLDPLGTDLELGVGFYPNLMRALAGSLIDCLAQQR